MKYLVLIGDGMSDLPLKELGGKTLLEYAKTPNLDYLARHGQCGWVNNVPKGMPPGSDVAAMSIFGYDPKKCYTGRGPLEAASLGVKLKKDEVAFRCNLVTIEDGKMADFTSGHISTKEADQILKTLNRKLGGKGIRFVTGLSYRHLLIFRHSSLGTSPFLTTPPHNITGKLIERYLPKNDAVRSLMSKSITILLEHPVNLKRIKQDKKPASMIWLWGQGAAPDLKPFKKQYGKSAAVITAVHLLKGLGKILGMKVLNVPGATGFLDTNYKGKAQYALRALKRKDLVLVHVEAPDEAGHMGDVKGKVRAIEDFDRLVVGTIMSNVKCQMSNVRILVLPDHPTPIKLMTHTSDAVPFVIYDSSSTIRTPQSAFAGFNERVLKKSHLRIKDGWRLMGRFLSRKGS